MPNKKALDKLGLDKLLTLYTGQTVQIQELYNKAYEDEISEFDTRLMKTSDRPSEEEAMNIAMALLPKRIHVDQLEYDFQIHLETSKGIGGGLKFKLFCIPVMSANAFLQKNKSSSVKMNIQIKHQLINNY